MLVHYTVLYASSVTSLYTTVYNKNIVINHRNWQTPNTTQSSKKLLDNVLDEPVFSDTKVISLHRQEVQLAGFVHCLQTNLVLNGTHS